MSENENVKLSVDEQIKDLQEKGITFNMVNKEDAEKFLRYNTYYFKIKSYARNFAKATEVYPLSRTTLIFRGV